VSIGLFPGHTSPSVWQYQACIHSNADPLTVTMMDRVMLIKAFFLPSKRHVEEEEHASADGMFIKDGN